MTEKETRRVDIHMMSSCLEATMVWPDYQRKILVNDGVLSHVL